MKALLAIAAALSVLGAARSLSADPDSTHWKYVAQPSRPNQVKLPPNYRACNGDNETITVTGTATLVVWKTTQTKEAARRAEKAAQCGTSGAKVTIDLGPPALRKRDVGNFAFSWDAKNPSWLDVYLELKTPMDLTVLRNTRLHLEGTAESGTFQGYSPENELPVYHFQDIRADLAMSGGRIALEPIDRSLDHDADTGEAWDQKLEARNWLTSGTQIVARFAKPQQSESSDMVRTVLPPTPLDRFIELGSITCGTHEEACLVSRSDKGLIMETAAANLDSGKLKKAVDLRTTVVAMQASKGHLSVLSDRVLSVGLVATECVYELTQLTRVESGRSQVEALYLVQRQRGSPGDCAENRWDVIAKKAGTSDVVASGSATVSDNVATVRWQVLPQVTPNVQTSYDLGLKYQGGQTVATRAVPKLVVEAARAPKANLRVFTSPEDHVTLGGVKGLFELTARKALAAERENLLDLSDLTNPPRWSLEVIGARSFFPPCAAPTGPMPASVSTQLCVAPAQPTEQTLQIRATEKAPAKEILLSMANSEQLGATADRVVALGSLEFDTGFSAKPYRVAINLERFLQVVCDSRVIDGLSGGRPVSVGWSAFDHCRLVLKPGDTDQDAVALLKRVGTQSLDISAGLVPSDNSTPKLVTLERIKFTTSMPLEKCDAQATVAKCLSAPLRMCKIAGEKTVSLPDYGIVQVSVKHVQDWYETTAVDSSHESILLVRVRRQPRFLTLSSDTGLGTRVYATFTVAPLTLFRAPHSGRKVWKSSEASKLEAATFGTGLIFVGELWDFDRNSAVLPLLAPQIHLGALGTMPTTTDLDYPSFSVVGGIGFRTGLDTTPDAATESSLKFLFWFERLWTFGGRRGDGSWNVLFGLGVDIGSFGN